MCTLSTDLWWPAELSGCDNDSSSGCGELKWAWSPQKFRALETSFLKSWPARDTNIKDCLHPCMQFERPWCLLADKINQNCTEELTYRTTTCHIDTAVSAVLLQNPPALQPAADLSAVLSKVVSTARWCSTDMLVCTAWSDCCWHSITHVMK